jgi:hypothetical protein
MRRNPFRPAALPVTVLALLAGCGGPPDGAPEPAASPPAAGTDCATGPVFTDVAAAAGLDFTHWTGMTGEDRLPEVTGGGAAFLDYDRDGDLDVYLVQGNLLDPRETAADAVTPPPGALPLSDRLYRNDGPAAGGGGPPRFTDVTGPAGLAATGYGMGVAVGDVDNDGWPDLYVTNLGADQLWRNQGDGTFRDVTGSAGVDDRAWSVPAVFFDFDADGWLDLFVGHYVDFNLGNHRRCQTATGAPDYCGPLSYQPTADRLWRNDGDGTFTDVTRQAGMAAAKGNALGAAAADLDGDGRLDLYVANDQVANFLWLNQGDGTFRDEALFAGAAVSGEGRAQASMGVEIADFDEDADLDLFMTHLSEETSTLYRNDGAGGFLDDSAASGIGMASWALTGFGTGALDFDQDGRLDLLSVNGAVRKIPEQMQTGDPYPLRQPRLLLRNAGGGRFEDATAAGGPALAVPEVGRGAAFGDVDGDGDTDVLVNNSHGPARLLLNTCGQEREWIGFEVVDRHGRAALGATLTLELAGGGRLVRRVRTDGSYASAQDPRVTVGLHERPAPLAAVVRWVGGGEERFTGLATRRYQRLVEGAGAPAG